MYIWILSQILTFILGHFVWMFESLNNFANCNIYRHHRYNMCDSHRFSISSFTWKNRSQQFKRACGLITVICDDAYTDRYNGYFVRCLLVFFFPTLLDGSDWIPAPQVWTHLSSPYNTGAGPRHKGQTTHM